MRLPAFCLLICLAPGPAALAQSAPDAFDICARQQEATARLACFDQQIAARRAAHQANAPSAASAAGSTNTPAPAKSAVPAVAAPASASESTVGLDAQQVQKLHPESAKPAPTILEAKVTAVIARRPLISAFVLDTGQVWEQTESVDGLWIKPGESVTIREGSLGGFLLKSADGDVVRVKRVK